MTFLLLRTPSPCGRRDQGIVLLLVVLLLPVHGYPPSCRHINKSSKLREELGESIHCFCRNSDYSSYTGNLNFLKSILRALPGRYPERRSRTNVFLRNCSKINLELNFHSISDFSADTISLNLQDSADVKVEGVTMTNGNESLMVQNVDRFAMTGDISCPQCDDSPVFKLQVVNVSRINLEHVESSVLFMMTARFAKSLEIRESTFLQMPWPGIYIFSIDSVGIVESVFQNLPGHKTISINKVSEVNISHNILDVDKFVEVTGNPQKTVECNKRTEEDELPIHCPYPNAVLGDQLQVEDVQPEASGGIAFYLNATRLRRLILAEPNIIPVVVGVSDAYGTVWILVAILFTLIFLLIMACCTVFRRKKKRREESSKGINDLIKSSSHLGAKIVSTHEDPTRSGDEDEYSNSSRAHLAHAGDGGNLHMQYVMVQGVRTEAGEDGVVCGSLTLGPSYPAKRTEAGSSPGINARTMVSNQLKQQTFSNV